MHPVSHQNSFSLQMVKLPVLSINLQSQSFFFFLQFTVNIKKPNHKCTSSSAYSHLLRSANMASTQKKTKQLFSVMSNRKIRCSSASCATQVKSSLEKKKLKTQIISQTGSKVPGPAAFNKLVLTTL